MRGFLIFLAIVFLALGGLGYYMLTHQDPDSTVVRMNGKWVVIKKNGSTEISDEAKASLVEKRRK